MGCKYSFQKLEACFLVRSIEIFVYCGLREREETRRGGFCPCLSNELAPDGKFSDTSLPSSFCIEFWSRRNLFYQSLRWKERVTNRGVYYYFNFSSRSLPNCWNISRRQDTWVNDDRWWKCVIIVEPLKRWMQFKDVIKRKEQWGCCMWQGFILDLGQQDLRKTAGSREDCSEKSAVAEMQNCLF